MIEPAITERYPGLSEVEAQKRLAEDGPNELPGDKRRTWISSVLGVLAEPMLLLLLGGATLYFWLGELQDAITLSTAVVVVITITLVQERRTENALAALRDLSSPRARVIRDGRERRIPGRDVVRGDFVALAEGDRVPADGVFRECLNLQADESLLTGESVPVRKRPTSRLLGEIGSASPGGEDLPFSFSGSLIVRGQGLLEVTVVGSQTAIGRIGTMLGAVERERTPLQQQIGRLVLTLSVLAAVLCSLVVVALGLRSGDWVDALLAGIALAMASLPEEFPVVLTVFLALGAWRLSKVRVLTRRLPALENLGAATVVCTDKTGTLTENRMEIARLVVGEEVFSVPGAGVDHLPDRFHEIVELGILASQHDPFDPMEKAFKRLGEATLAGTEHLHSDWTLEREYPLSAELLAMSHVWSAPDGGRHVIAAKGAPEAIADLCHLSERDSAALLARVKSLAGEGLRVLGVARAYFERSQLPDHQHAFDFRLEGLVALADPVRPTAAGAVEACHAAGLRVIMITGDYPETARAIGRTVGLAGERVTSGDEVEGLEDGQLADLLDDTSIVARAVPEQKLRIVRALQDRGEIVVMTGDGVNDAPALKAASIGVAMGGRGTDVAREAADLVVTDDDFASIVEGVATGRRIQDNLRRALAYVLAVHVPIVGIALAPALFGWPLILLPVHIAFLELVIDPACSIVFEAEPADPETMRRPPRGSSVQLFGRRLIAWSIVQGVSVLLVVVGVLWASQEAGHDADTTRALTFVSLIAGNLTLILVNRSWSRSALASMARRNLAFWIVSASACAFLGVALLVPSAANLFTFGSPPWPWVLLASISGAVSLAWFEVLKWWRPEVLTER